MSHQSIEECVASKQIRRETKALHLVENLHGKVGLLGLDIGTNGGVKKGFGSEASRVEKAVELVVAMKETRRDLASENLQWAKREGRKERREWGEEVREFENSFERILKLPN